VVDIVVEDIVVKVNIVVEEDIAGEVDLPNLPLQ